MNKVTPQELQGWINDESTSPKLVDVREQHENEAFNIGGALIPVGDLPLQLDDFPYEKTDRIVVYCRSGMRSQMAQHLLMEAGYADVWNLEGGMLAWQEMTPS